MLVVVVLFVDVKRLVVVGSCGIKSGGAGTVVPMLLQVPLACGAGGDANMLRSGAAGTVESFQLGAASVVDVGVVGQVVGGARPLRERGAAVVAAGANGFVDCVRVFVVPSVCSAVERTVFPADCSWREAAPDQSWNC